MANNDITFTMKVQGGEGVKEFDAVARAAEKMFMTMQRGSKSAGAAASEATGFDFGKLSGGLMKAGLAFAGVGTALAAIQTAANQIMAEYDRWRSLRMTNAEKAQAWAAAETKATASLGFTDGVPDFDKYKGRLKAEAQPYFGGETGYQDMLAAFQEAASAAAPGVAVSKEEFVDAFIKASRLTRFMGEPGNQADRLTAMRMAMDFMTVNKLRNPNQPADVEVGLGQLVDFYKQSHVPGLGLAMHGLKGPFAASQGIGRTSDLTSLSALSAAITQFNKAAQPEEASTATVNLAVKALTDIPETMASHERVGGVIRKFLPKWRAMSFDERVKAVEWKPDELRDMSDPDQKALRLISMRLLGPSLPVRAGEAGRIDERAKRQAFQLFGNTTLPGDVPTLQAMRGMLMPEVMPADDTDLGQKAGEVNKMKQLYNNITKELIDPSKGPAAAEQLRQLARAQAAINTELRKVAAMEQETGGAVMNMRTGKTDELMSGAYMNMVDKYMEGNYSSDIRAKLERIRTTIKASSGEGNKFAMESALIKFSEAAIQEQTSQAMKDNVISDDEAAMISPWQSLSNRLNAQLSNSKRDQLRSEIERLKQNKYRPMDIIGPGIPLLRQRLNQENEELLEKHKRLYGEPDSPGFKSPPPATSSNIQRAVDRQVAAIDRLLEVIAANSKYQVVNRIDEVYGRKAIETAVWRGPARMHGNDYRRKG